MSTAAVIKSVRRAIVNECLINGIETPSGIDHIAISAIRGIKPSGVAAYKAWETMNKKGWKPAKKKCRFHGPNYCG